MKLLCLSILLLSTIAFAGHDTGGGGIGLKIGNKIYLYDFVEAGIEEDVYISPSQDDEMNARTTIELKLRTSTPVVDRLVYKLNEIYKLSPSFAKLLLETMKSYQWRFVKPSLIQTGDIGRSPIRVSADQMQIAYRDDSQKTVTIDNEVLSKMPLDHKAGLIIHEIIYSMSEDNSSYKSRTMTSYLFHPQFQTATFEELQLRVSLFKETLQIFDYPSSIKISSTDYINSCVNFRNEVKVFNKESYNTLRDLFNLLQDKYNELRSKNNEELFYSSKKVFPGMLNKLQIAGFKYPVDFFEGYRYIFTDNSSYEDFAQFELFYYSDGYRYVYDSDKGFYLPINTYAYRTDRRGVNQLVTVFSLSDASIALSENQRLKAKEYLTRNDTFLEKEKCLKAIDVKYLKKMTQTYLLNN